MKLFIVLVFSLLSFFLSEGSYAKDSSGKYLFYNSKGKYGSCNVCHLNGLSSAGRWNFETNMIDPDEGRKIPVLKEVAKRKNQEQLERSIQLMKKLFDFKLTEEQITQLAEYLGTI